LGTEANQGLGKGNRRIFIHSLRHASFPAKVQNR